MTALRWPQLRLEMDLTGTAVNGTPTWTDYSSYLRVGDGVSCSRGRQDERSKVTAGTLSISLDNDAGTFSGKPLRAHVRLSVRFDDAASYTVLFTGNVSSWRRGWANGVRPVVQVTATDRVALLEKQTLKASVVNEIMADAPAGYWPMWDPSGATTAADGSGVVGRTALTIGQQGSGGTVDFGVTTTLVDAGTGVAVAAVDTSNYKYLTADGFAAATAAECFFRTSTKDHELIRLPAFNSSGTIVRLTVGVAATTGYLYVNHYDYNAGLFTRWDTTVNVADNVWHHVAVAGSSLWLDGAGVGTSSSAGGSGTPTDIPPPSVQTGAACTAAFAHVAVYYATPSSGRIADHYKAGRATGFTGDLTDTRFDRLAAYAGVTPYTPWFGSATMCAQPVDGKTVWDAMNEVADAEGGIAYVAADGAPSLATRGVWQAPAVALTLSPFDIDPGTEFTLDDSDIVNDVTVTRPGGTVVRSVDTASVAAHGARTESITLFVDTDAQAQATAQWMTYRGAVAAERISTLTVSATAKRATVDNPTLAALDVGSAVTITDPSPGTDEYVDGYVPAFLGDARTLVVQGMQDRFDVTGWTRTLNVAPLPLVAVWKLDNATYSVLDSTTVLGY